MPQLRLTEILSGRQGGLGPGGRDSTPLIVIIGPPPLHGGNHLNSLDTQVLFAAQKKKEGRGKKETPLDCGLIYCIQVRLHLPVKGARKASVKKQSGCLPFGS